MSSRRARYLQDALSDRHEPAGQCSWPTWALRGGVRGGCSAPWGPYRSHEWVQRRILRAFVESGGDITEEYEVQHLVRYVESALALLPPKTRLAVETAWAADEDASWEWLATSLSLGERSEVSPPAARQRVSRGIRAIVGGIRQRRWERRSSGTDGV